MVMTQHQRDLLNIQHRTRKLLIVSGAAHIAFFAWLFFMRQFVTETEVLTEITWVDALDPVVEAQAATPEDTPPAPPAPAPAAKKQVEQNFERETEVAEKAPDPQELVRTQDQIASRLASLQKTRPKPLDTASLKPDNPASRSRLAGTAPAAPVTRPKSLARADTPAKAKPLRHAPRRVQGASLQTLPQVQSERQAPDRAETTATRELAGAQMTGPVADRPIVSYRTPTYPEWAKNEGVEASVMIYFVVLPDGRVKENVMVERTSGFADFDEKAVDAILAWQFEPLEPGVAGEQWGTILFHYRLE
jgi:TonB family protein